MDNETKLHIPIYSMTIDLSTHVQAAKDLQLRLGDKILEGYHQIPNELPQSVWINRLMVERLNLITKHLNWSYLDNRTDKSIERRLYISINKTHIT